MVSRIHTAIERGKYEEVERLLHDDPSLVSDICLQDSPLHTAATHGRKKIADLLLQRGADINARGDHGRTPLHCAVQNRNLAVVKLLLSAGADLTMQDNYRCTALYFAAAVNDETITKTLLQFGCPQDMLSALYIQGPEAVLTELQRNPALLNTIPSPQDLLRDAVRLKALALVEHLFQHGVSPNTPPIGDLPPLFQAILTYDPAMVRLFIAYDVDLSVTDHTGSSVLHFCTENRAPDSIKKLLRSAGAS